MADWAHDQSCSEVCVSRALEGRGWQEAELDAPRVVHAGNTSIPNIGLEYDLRLTLWGNAGCLLLLLMELDLLVKMYKLTTEHAVIPLRVGPALMRVRARRAPHRRRACIRSRQAACRQ